MKDILSLHYKIDTNYYIKLDEVRDLGIIILGDGRLQYINNLGKKLEIIFGKSGKLSEEIMLLLDRKKDFVFMKYKDYKLFSLNFIKLQHNRTKNLDIWIIVDCENNWKLDKYHQVNIYMDIKVKELIDGLLKSGRENVSKVSLFELFDNLADYLRINKNISLELIENKFYLQERDNKFYSEYEKKLYSRIFNLELFNELIEKFGTHNPIRLNAIDILTINRKEEFKELKTYFDIIHPMIYNNQTIGILAFKFEENSITTPNAIKNISIIANFILFLNMQDKFLSEIERNDILYKNILDLSEDAIALHSNGIIKFVNEAAVYIFRAENAPSLIGMNVMDFVHPESLPIVLERIKRMKEGKSIKKWQFEKMIALDGTILHVTTAAQPLSIHEKNFIMVIVRDVSRTINLEKKVYLSEQKYQTLIESSPDPIVIINENKLVFANTKALKVFSINNSTEIIGKKIHKFLPYKTEEELIDWVDNISEEDKYDKIIQLDIFTKDNEIRSMEISISPIIFENKDADLIFIRDRTDITLAQKLIKENEEKYRGLFENSSDAIYITSYTGVIKEVNKSFIQLFGYSFGELKSMNASKLYNHEEDRERLLKVLIERGFVSGYEIELVTKTGNVLICKLSTHTRYNEKEGLVEFQGLIRDITEEKKITESILLSQKLESLGLLASGIAHDFNNLLMGILSASSLVLKKIPKDAEVIPLLQIINDTSNKAASLVNQLLAYAGEATIKKEPANLSKIIREMEQLIKLSVPSKVRLNFAMKDIFSRIFCDKIQIEQIILNLIKNSSDAIGGVEDRLGEIKIITEVMLIEDQKFLNLINMEQIPKGLYSCLIVEDNGRGIPHDKFSMIFDPFYTSKMMGRGLGLAAVMGIIKAHEGAIILDSVINAYTIFTIFFPIKTIDTDFDIEEKSMKKNNLEEVKSNINDKIILVIDDEDIVRTIVKRLLKALGYGVILAEGGNEAIEIVKSNTEINLILLDLTMPEMNGLETFKKIKQLNEKIPVIISSGYSESDIKSQFKGLDIDGFLHKPYTIDEIKLVMTSFLK